MRSFLGPGLTLALLLHGGIVLILVLWSWFKPAPKQPPAVFEMVSLSLPPPSEIQENTATADAPVRFNVPRWRPVQIPQPQPPQPQPAPQPQQRQPDRTPQTQRQPSPQSRQPAATQPERRQTLSDFQRANPQQNNRPAAQPRETPRTQVRAPSISTAGVTPTLANASSRSQHSSLNAAQQRELDTYYGLLHAFLQNAWIPPEGVRGPVSVTVSFTVLPNGDLTAARVVTSSGFPVFDESALRVFRELRNFRPTPNQQSWSFTIDFSLRD